MARATRRTATQSAAQTTTPKRKTRQTTNHTANQTRTQRASTAQDPEPEHRGYGGASFGAAFFGWLVATALASIFAALIAAGGTSLAISRIEQNAGGIVEILQTIGLVGSILMLAALAIAYFAGGYVAGRMAPFAGALQGFGVWAVGIAITLLLALAGVLFGPGYNVVQQLNLPRIPVDEGALTTNGLVYLIAAVIISLGAAIAGSRVGERHYQRVTNT